MSIFNQYSWLEQSFQQIKKSYDAEKLPHALLITAPQDSGKMLFSKELAQSILCELSTQQLMVACGKCKNCLLVNAESHPDLSVIDCLIDNKGKQKKSIGIEQIRQANQKLVETSQFNGWRIAIISSVEKMTRGSFNALLKTLEEPGDKTLLLLLANNLQQVPATIKSRCQLLSFKLLEQTLVPWLISLSKCSEETAIESLKECHNAPFAALKYIKQEQAQVYKKLHKDLDKVFTTEISAADFLTTYTELEEQLWQQIALYFKNVQLSQLQSKTDQYSKVPSTFIAKLYFELLDYNRGQCAGSNLQAKLQLEAILIQWFELGRKIVHYSR